MPDSVAVAVFKVSTCMTMGLLVTSQACWKLKGFTQVGHKPLCQQAGQNFKERLQSRLSSARGWSFEQHVRAKGCCCIRNQQENTCEILQSN